MTLAVCYFVAAAAMAALFLIGLDPLRQKDLAKVWAILALIGLIVWGVTLRVVARLL